MPKFRKGVSGNPGGRPRGYRDFALLARQHAPEALERLMHWVRSNKETASVSAARAVIERGYGRPPTMEEAAALIPSDNDKAPSTFKVVFVTPSRRGEDDE
jgi:hypothetical protein